jgi:bacillithiol synthase
VTTAESGTPVVRTESLGGSPLSRAARAGQLPQWYPALPRGAAHWREYGRSVADSVSSTWLDELHGAIDLTGHAAQRLNRSAGGKGLVITTGQQPGLFGGPMMTLMKAISARAIADALQELTGIPVAPLFWAATDDADFDEAAVVSVALDGGARELRLEQVAPAATPMARAPIGGDIDALVPLLREACGSSPHASYVDDVLSAFRQGAMVGDAYVALLRQILDPLEIAVLDASHPSVARTADAMLRRAAMQADDVADAVRRRDEEIVAGGYRPQVDEVAGLSLVSLNAEGTKRRLSLHDASALGELSNGHFLSSTVLLRPVIERAILPTAAYVGGPGEVAYFAQVSAVAEALGAEKPLVVPRWSATIVEPRVQAILDKFALTAESIADPHAVDGRIARERLPAETAQALTMLRADITSDIERLRKTSDGLVPPTVLDGVARSLAHRLERLERRFVAGVKNRETTVMRQLATARGALFPHGARQERKLAYIPFLARYGPALLEQMLGAARAHARTLVLTTPSVAPTAVPERASV